MGPNLSRDQRRNCNGNRNEHESCFDLRTISETADGGSKAWLVYQ